MSLKMTKTVWKGGKVNSVLTALILRYYLLNYFAACRKFSIVGSVSFVFMLMQCVSTVSVCTCDK